MFIKNYADTDFVIKYKGGVKTLFAQDVTYIDDNWVTFPVLYAMFGDYIGLVEGETPIEEFLFDNQVIVEPERVYEVIKVGPGAPRIFIKGGKATIYFADGVKPADIDEMITSDNFTDLTGLIMPTAITNYLAIKADKGTKVIFTNFKLV
jgi:hypothetical protein